MSYNRENYIRIREEFEKRNLRARQEADRRTEELHAKLPDVAIIDRELSMTGVRIFAESMNGKAGLDERIAKLRRENEEARKIRAKILEDHGYPADYSSVKYACDKCSDTGFIGSQMCDCMRRELIMAGYESSGIGNLIRTQSFETFDLNYYRQTPEQHDRMALTLEKCKQFAYNFEAGSGKNLLLCGTTGLGKTHMSTSIAKVVIERGFDVVYDTAQNFLSDFEYERFGRSTGDSSESRTQKYFNCDLLIIDDLGSEVSNQFTISCFYNVINTRINSGRSMILNTNLREKDIRERYNDRITSRLFGEFNIFLFFGKDIREQKTQE
ncbi:MAG: ATP-binding protein [Clostridiales bacterium]|nr:ATP-binding protein [Clostridiales bacterium]